MTWTDFVNGLNILDTPRGETIKFDDGTMIEKQKFTERFQSFFDGTIDSLINCEKATEGWKNIFNKLPQ